MMQSQPFLDRGAVISFLVAAVTAFVMTFFVQPQDAWVPYVAAVAAFFVTAAVLNLRGKK